MATAVGRPKPYSGEAIRRYEKDEDDPGNHARKALAAVFECSEAYIEFGAPPQPKTKVAEGDSIARGPREEMILLLFRSLTPEQQRELILETNALVTGNREIQTRFIGKPIHTYSNEEVAAAFGPVPKPFSPRKSKPRRRTGGLTEEDPE